MQCNLSSENFFFLTFQAKHHLVQAEIEFFPAFLILEKLDLVTLHHFDPLVMMQCSKLHLKLELNLVKEGTTISLYPSLVRWDNVYSFKHL